MPGPDLILRVMYDRDQISEAGVDRILSDFEIALSHAAAHPEAKLSDISDLLDDYDRQRRAIRETEIKESRRQKLRGARRRGLSIDQVEG
jgi:hypothetical protein